MKRFVALLIAVVMLLSFPACGNNREQNTSACWNCGEIISSTAAFCQSCGSAIADKPNSTEPAVSETETDSTQSMSGEVTVGATTETTEPTAAVPAYADVADVEKIKNDLIAEEANCFYLNNQPTYLNIDSIEILRRKTDPDYDEVHVAMVFADDYYVVNVEYILCYAYYDIGGWCLDDYVMSEYQSKAIANPASDSDFIEFMQNYFSSCTITDRTQSTDPTGAYTETFHFTATLDYAYLSVSFSGWYAMQFYDDCWHDTVDFWINNYDWSAFDNTFRYRDQSINIGAGFYSADVIISLSNIEQISEDKLSVTYSGSVYLYDKTGDFIEEDEEIAQNTTVLNISSERITILGKEIEIPRRVRYIRLPWYGTFAVFLDRDDGVEATEDTTYDDTFAHFDRVVSDDELQDAMDKLNDLNS